MIFAANFKMNHTRASTVEYVAQLEKLISESGMERDVYVFPPTSALLCSSPSIRIGAQNAYMAKNGAYTGETGLEQLGEFGIDTILIGHSERRQLMGETHSFVAEKFGYFAEHGFRIVYCIGEPLEVREDGEEAVAEYLLEEFVGIDTQYENLIVEDEPIWAIGTGRSARVEEIESVHGELRNHIKCPILYGGSVKTANIAEITAIPNVDGVLVGSAFLDAAGFFEMMEKSSTV